jgi:hypothetical protein
MRRVLSGRAARRLSAVALVALLSVLPACRKSDRVETYPVKGKLLVDGKPAKGANVTFHPREATNPPYAPTGQADENGEFSIATFVAGDGAPAGEYDVTVVWPVRYNPISTLWEGDKLGGRYGKKENPAKRVTVEKRPQELAPFEFSTTPPK